MKKVKRIVINAPLYVTLERKTKKDKKVSINLNTYRNLHYQINNQVKKKFAEEILSQIEHLEIEGPVSVTYRVYKPTKRILDKMNVVSIVSKYLMDALTENNFWKDDNDDIVKTEILLPTMIDKENPRCEVVIKNVNIKEDDSME